MVKKLLKEVFAKQWKKSRRLRHLLLVFGLPVSFVVTSVIQFSREIQKIPKECTENCMTGPGVILMIAIAIAMAWAIKGAVDVLDY